MSKPDLRTVLDQLRHLHPGLEGFSEAFTEALDRHITRRALRSRSVDATFGSGPMPEPEQAQQPEGRTLLREKVADLLSALYHQLTAQGMDDQPVTIVLTGHQLTTALQGVREHEAALQRAAEGSRGSETMEPIIRKLVESNHAAAEIMEKALQAHHEAVTAKAKEPDLVEVEVGETHRATFDDHAPVMAKRRSMAPDAAPIERAEVAGVDYGERAYTFAVTGTARKIEQETGDDIELMAALAGDPTAQAIVRTWPEGRLALSWAKAYQMIMRGSDLVPHLLRRKPGQEPVPSTLAELRLTHLWRLSIGATINQPQAPSLLKPPTTPVLITQDQALLIAARIGPFGVRQRANHAMRDWDAQRYTDTRMTLSNRMHTVAFPTNVNGPDPRD